MSLTLARCHGLAPSDESAACLTGTPAARHGGQLSGARLMILYLRLVPILKPPAAEQRARP